MAKGEVCLTNLDGRTERGNLLTMISSPTRCSRADVGKDHTRAALYATSRFDVREAVAEDHQQAALIATAKYNITASAASASGLSIEAYMASQHTFPYWDAMDEDYMRAFIVANQREALREVRAAAVEAKAIAAGLTVEEFESLHGA